MIDLELCLYVFITLAAHSRGLPTTGQNVPSQIVMNENFREPVPSAILSEPSPVVSNFVHQGTNFFFNPQLLLGTFVPPQIGRIVATVYENITETPVITEDPVLLNDTEPKQITPTEFPPILIDESIVVHPPFPPPILINEPIIVHPPIPPSILINESIIVPPPSPPPLIPIEIPLIPDNTIMKEIPPAPILPPFDLLEITKIIEQPEIETFPPFNETDTTVPKVISIKPIEPHIKILERGFIHIVPKQIIMKIVQIPVTLEFPTSAMPDISKILDEEETVVLIPPVPEIPAIIHPASPIEGKFLQKPFDLSIPTECVRDIIVERVLPNIVISKKTLTKRMEFIAIPTAVDPVLTASVFPNIIVKT